MDYSIHNTVVPSGLDAKKDTEEDIPATFVDRHPPPFLKPTPLTKGVFHMYFSLCF